MIDIRWTRDSLTGRLSLYFGVGTLLTFCFLGTVLFVVIEQQVQQRNANELSTKTAAVERLLNDINKAVILID